MERWEELEGIQGGEIIIKIYCIKKNLVSIKEKESKTFLIRLCDVPSPHKYSLRASLGLIPT